MKDLKTEIKLSSLWIIVMINMLYADVFSIIVELVNKNTLEIPGDVTTIMAIAAIVTNIPIFMIYFSRVLNYKLNRLLNIIAGVFTIIYVIGGGDLSPHYIVVMIIDNESLTNLDFLKGIKHVNGSIRISGNSNLTDFSGLANIESVKRAVQIEDNGSIDSTTYGQILTWKKKWKAAANNR